MLLCVCLNPAVDVTYLVPASPAPGHSYRVSQVHERAGGKGINVARVARLLGQAVTVLAPIGGTTGEFIRTELAAAGLPAVLIDVAEPTRRTLAVVDPDDATVFNEPGPTISGAEWSTVQECFAGALDRAELVVLTGSLPPGIPLDSYRVLAQLAGERGIPVLVDAEGEALRLALLSKPYLVKPNLPELAGLVGGKPSGSAEIARAAAELRSLGARNVVVSCGGAGLVAVTEDGAWHGTSPETLTGNPTGAGDALVAALAVGVILGRSWPELLRDGVAWSAAAVPAPVAGEIDRPTLERLAPGIVITELATQHPAPTTEH